MKTAACAGGGKSLESNLAQDPSLYFVAKWLAPPAKYGPSFDDHHLQTTEDYCTQPLAILVSVTAASKSDKILVHVTCVPTIF